MITTKILTQTQMDYGLSTEEIDDHILALLDPKGYVIARYYQSSVNTRCIQKDADEYLRATVTGVN